MIIKGTDTHKGLSIGDIIGQFEFLEGDGLLHPLFSGSRRVWVDVGALGGLRVGLAGHRPGVVVELVTILVTWHNVHQHHVFGLWVETEHIHLVGREHSTERRSDRVFLKRISYSLMPRKPPK